MKQLFRDETHVIIYCSKCQRELHIANGLNAATVTDEHIAAAAIICNWSLEPLVCYECNGEGIPTTRDLEAAKAQFWKQQYEKRQNEINDAR